MRGMTRSIELFKGFRHEQQDPVSFYKLLADDAVQEISRSIGLSFDWFHRAERKTPHARLSSKMLSQSSMT